MQSYLGMNQTTTSQKKDGSLRKRPAAQSAPKRSGDIWESVEILIENDTAPRCGPNAVSRSVLSAVSHTVVRRPSGATAGLITVEFNYELSYITTESLISIHPLAPLTRWYHAVCAQSAYRVHTAIVLSENERS